MQTGQSAGAAGPDFSRVRVDAADAATCETQGGVPADADAAREFASALSARGGRLALVRLGWPAERDVRFVTGAVGTAWGAVSWQGEAFVPSGESGGPGYPLCVRR